ncbi:hypothetical protein A7985_11570 [Pseudoalteromonas luteoviolacea]|uniref:Uncharacterized protein n=1 Tax=Pseudoalteromonas luteoviolacea TaxID=43657 RepID=A0A1C0TQM7_9GAMM|nr:hypothetical protein A7985_11570 [Pseudoalteromonas luteoviolacea]
MVINTGYMSHDFLGIEAFFNKRKGLFYPVKSIFGGFYLFNKLLNRKGIVGFYTFVTYSSQLF